MRTPCLIIILFPFLILTLGAHSYFLYAQAIEIPQVEVGNLEFHLITEDSVDIKVFIDGKLAINEEFIQKQKNPDLGIVPHKIFQFKLKPGKHLVTAQAHQGQQTFTGEFKLIDKRWVVLYYVDPQRLKQKEPFSMEVYKFQVMYQ